MSVVLGVYALGGGLISFIGWVANQRRLTDWFDIGISIQPNTAVATVCSGMALLLFVAGYRRVSAALGAVVAFIGMTTLVQYIFAVDFSSFNSFLMFGREWGRANTVSPGRMGPPGALSWTLLGTAFVLGYRARVALPRIALVTLAIAGLSFAGYSYGADRLFSLPYLTAVALQTATFIAALSAGIMAAVPEEAPTAWFLDEGATGAVARRGIPLIIVIPFLAGWIRLWGERSGFYDASFGTAMLVVVLVILLLGVLSWSLRTIQRNESALRSSQQQMGTTLQSIADGFVTLDHEWRFRFVNPEAARLLEKSPEQLVGNRFWDLFPEAVGGFAYHELHRAAAERTNVEFEDFNPVLERWFATRAYPTADGAISVYFHDVTARKQAERDSQSELIAMSRLQELSTRLVQSGEFKPLLREILAAAIELTGTIKGNIQILDAESNSLRLFVYEGFGSDFVEYFRTRGAPYGCELAAESRRRVVVSDLDSEEEWRGTPELRVLLADGIRAFQSTPLVSRDGRLLGIMNTHFTRPRQLSEREVRHLDLLARMAADFIERSHSEEERQRADRMKDEFLAMLAHELRNPLAPIQNAVHVLRHSTLSADTVQSTTDILHRQVAQLVRLVDDLVDVSRITRGKIELVRDMVDLVPVITQAAEAVRPLVEEKRQVLDLRLPDQPTWVYADPARLAQVVGNILSNASKFTGGGGRIQVTVEHEGPQHVIRVRDDGIGISGEQLPRIFDLFMQGDTSLERTSSGLGIGLTLVKTLVEMHGGSVDASSDGPGHGSEFVVRLPALSNATRSEVGTTNGSVHDAPARQRRVLIVDDNEDGASSLARILELSGHFAQTAHDGEEAVNAAERFRPDVVLLDIGLPKLNGYEACRRIREQPWGKEMLLVALTGWGAESYRQRSRDAGFDTHVVKPVNSRELLRILNATGSEVQTARTSVKR
jgi:PAS domain S-box-containing protein